MLQFCWNQTNQSSKFLINSAILLSLPVWECGLKFYRKEILSMERSHSPCGSVDWNLQHFQELLERRLSLPVWECGLKLKTFCFSPHFPRHSPCGSVDWNKERFLIFTQRLCHSPCGSVDWNKQKNCFCKQENRSHSPCGSVDWNWTERSVEAQGVSHSPCGSVDWNYGSS